MPRDLPPWLQRTEEEVRRLNVNTQRGFKYWRARLIASGPWTDTKAIRRLYREAERRRAHGQDVVVDHIVPLTSPLVCGLECHWNMEIVTWAENATKGNRWWPDGPFDDRPYQQPDLFMADNGQLLLI